MIFNISLSSHEILSQDFWVGKDAIGQKILESAYFISASITAIVALMAL